MSQTEILLNITSLTVCGRPNPGPGCFYPFYLSRMGWGISPFSDQIIFKRLYLWLPGPLAQSEASQTADARATCLIPARTHTLVEIETWNNFYGQSPPLAELRRIFVDFKRKYVHEAQVKLWIYVIFFLVSSVLHRWSYGSPFRSN